MNKKPKTAVIFLIYIIIAAIFIFSIAGLNRSSIKQISYTELVQYIETNKVYKIDLEDSGKVTLTINSGDKYQTYAPNLFRDLEFSNELAQKGIEVSYTQGVGSSWWMSLLGYVLPILIIIIFWLWLLRPMMGGGKSSGMNFGKNPAKKYDPEKNKITFDNVAGIDESKEELLDIVKYLKNPEEFNKMGARMPKGILLVGPPGTGKTLTARAVAGEAGVPFFYISGSDFVELFVGVGAARVRDLFKNAKVAGSAIIFIDELDAVGRQRGAGLGGGNDEREQTLNQLLVELDGFEANLGIIVMAATNRPDVLDKALLRPGRFDKKVVIDGPDLKGREEILKIHIKGKKISPDIELSKLAKSTPGFVGADLENLINEAALLSIRSGKKYITMEDCEEAIERVLAGPARKSRLISNKEKKILAYHELGHAFMGYFLSNTDPIHKITIVPRGHSALGYTLQIPEEDKYLLNKSEILDRITYALGGRAAEQIIFNEITTGASDDLKKATKMAKNMVTRLGMSEKIGPLSWDDTDEDQVFLGREFGKPRNYSEETAHIIDTEIKKIINERYDIAKEILTKNKERLDLITGHLLKKENFSGKEFNQLMDMEIEELKKFVSSEDEDSQELEKSLNI
jgi:cell division protease FtsH